MQKPIKFKGKWFLPDSRDIKVPGTLYYDPTNGIKLTLDAAINTGKSDFESSWSSPDEVDIILGIVGNQQAITLYKCFETHHSMGGSDGFVSEWSANYLFTNIHAQKEQDLVFTELRAEIAYLFEWLNQSGLTVNGFPKVDEEIIIRYNRPQPINFQIDADVIGQLEFSYSYSTPNRHSNSIELNQSANLTIETNPGWAFDFEEVQEKLNCFLHWLTIATRFNCQPLRIKLYNRNFIEKTRNGIERKVGIELYTYAFKGVEKPVKKNFYNFNFNYIELENEMPQLLTRWYKLYPDLKIVNQILSQSIARENKFDETIFKDIAQALESFHRIRRNNERIPKVDYQLMKETILNDIQDENYRKFIEEKLHFGNEPTLADRLHALLNEVEIPTMKVLIDDYDDFVKKVKNNRNYYTHYDPKQKKKALDSLDLYNLNEKLLALLTVTVLSEVIQDKLFIDTWLRNSRRWGHLVRQKEKE